MTYLLCYFTEFVKLLMIWAPLMQNFQVYKQFTIGLVCSLLVVIATTVAADTPVSSYSLQLTAETSNPWAWPQPPDNTTGFSQRSKSWGKQYQGIQRPQYNNYRFVTPEILESLKQQQTQNQLTPENNQPLKPRSSRNYSYPSLGMGLTNPLYDTHTVSPWSNGSDNLYNDESLPLVPKEAIGGFSPFQVMPFGEMNNVDESRNTNIFNTFSYGRYGNLQ